MLKIKVRQEEEPLRRMGGSTWRCRRETRREWKPRGGGEEAWSTDRGWETQRENWALDAAAQRLGTWTRAEPNISVTGEDKPHASEFKRERGEEQQTKKIENSSRSFLVKGAGKGAGRWAGMWGTERIFLSPSFPPSLLPSLPPSLSSRMWEIYSMFI